MGYVMSVGYTGNIYWDLSAGDSPDYQTSPNILCDRHTDLMTFVYIEFKDGHDRWKEVPFLNWRYI